MEQVHDLSNPRPAHVAQLGQLAVVRDAASLDQLFKPDGQGHEAGDAWHSTRHWDGRVLFAASTGDKIAFDG